MPYVRQAAFLHRRDAAIKFGTRRQHIGGSLDCVGIDMRSPAYSMRLMSPDAEEQNSEAS